MNTILIVDDDSRNIRALGALLKTRGYDIQTATAMSEAFALMKGRKPSVILLDMMMPEMDGYQALSILRADDDWHSIPVIAVTAQAMKGDREKCLLHGATDYLSKPIDVDRMLEMLKSYSEYD